MPYFLNPVQDLVEYLLMLTCDMHPTNRKQVLRLKKRMGGN